MEGDQVQYDKGEIVVAVDDARLLAVVAQAVASCGPWTVSTTSPRELLRSPEMHRIVVCGAGTDVALLNQIVYARYMVQRPKRGIPFIAIVPPSALETNASLGAWLVDGHAAVWAVIADDGELPVCLRQFVARLTAGG